MKKIIKIWQENKVLLVLTIILIACIAIMVGVAIAYGYGTNDSDFETPAKIDSKLLTEIKEELSKKESVESANAVLEKKIVYITIKFVKDTPLEDAKKVAESAVELFNKDDLQECDIQFAISASSDTDKGYTLMGSRNKRGSGVVWGNYNLDNLNKDE